MAFKCNEPCVSCASPPIAGASGLGLSPLDPTNPYLNLSSEAPDVDLFIGNRPSINEPPLGSNWVAVGCLGFCFSSISQEDADLCAAQQAQLCAFNNWPDDVPNPDFPTNPDLPPFIPQDRPVFYNSAQSCSFTCPDGSLFNYTVNAGVFVALNQASADAMAASYACQKAVQNRLCVGEITANRCCAFAAFSGTITASTSYNPVTFAIVSGAIPPGMVLSQSASAATISGACPTPGDYSFTLRATSAIGATVDKAYTITVFGIVDTGVPDGQVGAAYSYTLSTGGTPAGTRVFSIASGALPDGLTLNSSTGEISGTPTVAGTYNFTIQVD